MQENGGVKAIMGSWSHPQRVREKLLTDRLTTLYLSCFPIGFTSVLIFVYMRVSQVDVAVLKKD